MIVILITNIMTNVALIVSEFVCGLLRLAAATAINDAQTNGGVVDPVFHVKVRCKV